MSEQEKLIDDIEQALAEQERNLRAEAEARKALTGEEPAQEPEPLEEADDFDEIDPWDQVYRMHARERRKKRRGEEVVLPYDETAPRPRQRVLEHREKKEAQRLKKQKVKEQSRKKTQEAAAEAVDGLTLWEEDASGRELSRRERRRKRIIEEEMAHDDPFGREWLTPEETRAIEHRDALRRQRTRRRAGKRRRRPGRIILLVILILIAAIVASGIGLYYTGKKELLASNISTAEQRAPEGAGVSAGAINYNGTTYRYNDDLINILVFGVAARTSPDGSKRYEATGIFLWSYDTEQKSAKLLPVPGRLMTDCPVYDDANEFLRMNDQQLGASYASGGTTELMRYQNVVNSVSGLLYGLPVSGYLVVDMEQIGKMNDLIGGVTLRVTEDLTEYDAALAEGEQITLSDSQAEIYVGERRTEAGTFYEMEAGLLQRQVQYMQGYLKRLKTAMLSPANMRTMLPELRQDTYADLELPEFVYLFVTLLTDDMDDETIAIPVDTEGTAETQEIRADQEALFEQVLSLFYES